MRQSLFLSLALLFALPGSAAEPLRTDSTGVVYADRAVRITLISPGVVRLEHSPSGTFCDERSFIAVERRYPPVAYALRRTARTVEVSTARLHLTYRTGTGRFTADNLSITSPRGKRGASFAWRPGQRDTLNLKGTYRTLDGYDGNLHEGREPMPIEDGLLSRSGWTLIDDSQGYLFDRSEWPWVEQRRETAAQDWYFMAYGHDYRSALHDYTLFAGRVPLPPRYAFGYWWSRYWTYTDNELRRLVSDFRSHGLPLDVLVVDMDWHYTERGRGGWTGYTWNRGLFPDPEGFVRWVRGEGLQVTFNLHPASGIASYEEPYAAMARRMGVDPKEGKTLEWDASSKRFMLAWYDTVLRPMERMGVSFWWLDWQQGLNDKRFPRLGNTWWINYTTFTDMERHRSERPMLYHRWGGLGNHRYQIGFSGDSYISWRSLDFQPYFNATASNVLYGYWSHDIGGHFHADRIDPEMYIRWMQFGALSPILRTHSSKNAAYDKEPWAFDDAHFRILRDIILQRYRMAPYIYTMAREAYESGVCLCRPMYYDYPEAGEAYANKNEYMFGDQMLVSPITAPMRQGRSEQRVWLPGGNDWYETATGTLLAGGQTVSRSFALDEYPLYVKAGSILPLYCAGPRNLLRSDEPVTVAVYPGGGSATTSFTLYEDNGNDKRYATQYATTLLRASRTDTTLTVSIGRRQGSYEGMPQRRNYSVRVMCAMPPRSVTVDGQQADFQYDGNTLSATVSIPQTDAAREKKVVFVYGKNVPVVADGTVGQMRRAQQANRRLLRHNAGLVFGDGLATLESAGRAITYHPGEAAAHLRSFRQAMDSLPALLRGAGVTGQEAEEYLRSVR